MDPFPDIDGDIQNVRNLIESGVSVNKKYGMYAASLLYFAAIRGRKDIVEYLIEQGADVNQPDIGMNTPLHGAVQCGMINIIECLIINGANIDHRTADDYTALMIASDHNYIEVVKYLLENRASKEYIDGEGDTAAGIARQNEHHAIADYIDQFEYLPTKGVHLCE